MMFWSKNISHLCPHADIDNQLAKIIRNIAGYDVFALSELSAVTRMERKRTIIKSYTYPESEIVFSLNFLFYL